MTDHRFRLSDEQFARPKPLLANKPRGVPRVDDRRVIGGIIDVIGRAKGGPNARPLISSALRLHASPKPVDAITTD